MQNEPTAYPPNIHPPTAANRPSQRNRAQHGATIPTPKKQNEPTTQPSTLSTQHSALRPAIKPLRPNQLTAARLLLAGHSVSAVAASLKIHPYTLSRWKRNPAFQAELRRQTDSLARNTAQQKPTPRNTPSPKMSEQTHLPFWQTQPFNPSQ